MKDVRTESVEKPAWSVWHDAGEPIRLGISSCLLGEEVRFDGGHKRDRYLTDVLGAWVEWVGVCPEVEIGLGTPRSVIRLESADGAVRLVQPTSGEDLTGRMTSWAERKVRELRQLDLDGYVLKRASPSCGIERVKVWGSSGMPSRSGAGVYARVLMGRWPLLPVEEEGRLNDPLLRESFIERVFCRHRWRTAVRRGLTRGRLVEFHTAHKLLLRSHNEAGYRRCGRIVAGAGQGRDEDLFAAYEDKFQRTLETRATPARHANVLYHVLGYLKRALRPGERHDLITVIEDYRAGLLPLIVPIALLRHHVHAHDVSYLRGQLYLEPHPKELMLRNRV